MNFSRLLAQKQPLIGLSPMDGVTDYPFRQIQTQIAKPDVLFTEFVSAEGISRGGVKLYDQLLFSPNQRPIVAQLFGKDSDAFFSASQILCHLGFDGIDINMGCPAKTVTNHGSGAALIAQPKLASEIISAVFAGVGEYQKNLSLKPLALPEKIKKVILRNQKFSSFTLKKNISPTISVKTRLGLDKPITKKWISHLLKHPLNFITLHGRTLSQGYAGLANWSEIAKAAKLVDSTQTKLWGNGDLSSRHQALDFCQKYGTSGALIGRAATGNPWLFIDHVATWAEKFSTMLLHTQIYLDTFPLRRFEPLRHHFLSYTLGHPRAKKLRARLVAVNSLPELLKLEKDFML